MTEAPPTTAEVVVPEAAIAVTSTTVDESCSNIDDNQNSCPISEPSTSVTVGREGTTHASCSSVIISDSNDVPPNDPTQLGSSSTDGIAPNKTNISNYESTINTLKAKKRIIIRRKKTINTIEGTKNKESIDPILYEKVTSPLPSAYQFEIVKTVERCMELQTTHIALQLPEGLLMYSTVLADILLRLVPCLEHVSILGDVTYGACCIDDIGASLLGAQLLVHYGHSCLVPIGSHNSNTKIPILYVFVEIQINVQHLVDCLIATLTCSKRSIDTNIYLLGTVQFRHALVTVKQKLMDHGYTSVTIPQVKPLSPGEVLGCTSPTLPTTTTNDTATTSIVCFVADGRFHMESTMICNPNVDTYYRYDPYSCTITIEQYEQDQMKGIRWNAIQKAMHAMKRNPIATTNPHTGSDTSTRSGCVFGIILGTLGRQGNPAIVQRIKDLLTVHKQKHFLMLLSEITPAKLKLFDTKINVWVQVACPRLSIDWGHLLSITTPVLSPYELFCCFDTSLWNHSHNSSYPMDYYSNVGGPWSNYHITNKARTMITTNEAKCCSTNKQEEKQSQIDCNDMNPTCCAEGNQCRS